MKKINNFLTYLEEKYKTEADFRVRSFGTFVQLTDTKEGGTLNFRFNKKGFFEGAYYKQDVYDKGLGIPLFTKNTETGKKYFKSTKPDFVSDRLKTVYADIYSDMDFDTVLKKSLIRSSVLKVDKDKLYSFGDRTFINIDAADELKELNLEKFQTLKGEKAIPLEETEFKNREIYECKNSGVFLIIDEDGLKRFMNTHKDFTPEVVSEIIVSLYPEVSKDEVDEVINRICKDDRFKETEDPEMEL